MIYLINITKCNLGMTVLNWDELKIINNNSEENK